MPKLVLVRHGQSQWNLENRFTGWTDVDLTQVGIEEARRAGVLLRDAHFEFDVAYTSLLKRAIRTLWLALEEMDACWLPVHRSWRLNERHYGALQGLNKKETAEKHGAEQVHQWRRGYNTRPPALEPDDARVPSSDRRYASLTELPLAESLQDTVERVVPYWNEILAPAIRSGKRILVSAHGNSLRALVKHLDGMSDEEIAALNIPTGIPMVYELDDSLQPLKRSYLGGEEEAEAAAAAVAAQSR